MRNFIDSPTLGECGLKLAAFCTSDEVLLKQHVAWSVFLLWCAQGHTWTSVHGAFPSAFQESTVQTSNMILVPGLKVRGLRSPAKRKATLLITSPFVLPAGLQPNPNLSWIRQVQATGGHKIGGYFSPCSALSPSYPYGLLGSAPAV